jgi:hypothetical protein
MIATAQTQETTFEPMYADLFDTIDQRSDGQQLVQENSCLRAIIAELLIKNQHLRWEVQRQQQQKMAGA